MLYRALLERIYTAEFKLSQYTCGVCNLATSSSVTVCCIVKLLCAILLYIPSKGIYQYCNVCTCSVVVYIVHVVYEIMAVFSL